MRLVKYVCHRDLLHRVASTDLTGHLVEGLAHASLVVRLIIGLAHGSHQARAQLLALSLACLELRRRLELARAQYVLGNQGHAVVERHGDDIALKVTAQYAPPTLVHLEGHLGMAAGIRVGLGDDPGGCVGDAQVHHLALLDEDVQRVHELLDTRRVVTVVHKQQVNVVGP